MWREELICASREELIECIMEQRHIIEQLERRILQLERNYNHTSELNNLNIINNEGVCKSFNKQYFPPYKTSWSKLRDKGNLNSYHENNFVKSKQEETPQRKITERTYREYKNLPNISSSLFVNMPLKYNKGSCNESDNDNNNTNYKNDNNSNKSKVDNRKGHVYNIHNYTEELDVEDGIREIERVLRLHNAGSPRLPNGVVAELLYIRRKLRESEADTYEHNLTNKENEVLQEVESSVDNMEDKEIRFAQDSILVERNDDEDDEKELKYVNSNNNNNIAKCTNLCRTSIDGCMRKNEHVTVHRPRRNIWEHSNSRREHRCEYTEKGNERVVMPNTPQNNYVCAEINHITGNEVPLSQRRSASLFSCKPKINC